MKEIVLNEVRYRAVRNRETADRIIPPDPDWPMPQPFGPELCRACYRDVRIDGHGRGCWFDDAIKR